jgi:serine/threonine-protein kinase
VTSNRDDIERRLLDLLEAALALPSADRENYVRTRTKGSPELRSRALALLAMKENDKEDIVTGGAVRTYETQTAPKQIGNYHIRSLIGRGGMGEVYLGERIVGDLDHLAAIKVVRVGAKSEKLAERLRAERQTLARLKHANIAQLHDGGETRDGAPYFVMEYVEGLALNSYLSTINPPTDECLRIFHDMCKAVAYAHRNLVIHHDLSPANALVSKDGVVKLIDFGISNTLDARSGDEPAAAHQSALRRTMTKGYAAPETMRGEPATTLSDIYSLGVILREMISGLGAPRKCDLDAIAKKASAAAPEARYQSVEALIADLQRFKRSEGVSAVGGDWRYFVKRLIGRRKIITAALAVGMLSVISTSIIMTALYQQANIARKEADQRFNDVRALANYMIFELDPELQSVAGATAIRASLIDKAQSYLDSLALGATASTELQMDIARGYRRLAGAVGGKGQSSIGRNEEARAYFRKADDILSALHAAHPDRVEFAIELADLKAHRSGIELYERTEPNIGLALAEEAAALLAPYDMDADPSEHLRVVKGKTLVAVGEAILLANDAAGALPHFLEAQALLAPLETGAADRDDLKPTLDKAISMSGDALYFLQRLDEAAAAYALTVKRSREDLAAEADNPHLKRDLAVDLWGHARILADLEHIGDALPAISEASSLMAENVSNDKGDKNARRLLGVINEKRGSILSAAGRHDEAIAALESARNTLTALRDEEPETAWRHYDVNSLFAVIADIHSAAGDPEEGCRWMTRARDEWAVYDDRWGIPELAKQGPLQDIIAAAGLCDEQY